MIITRPLSARLVALAAAAAVLVGGCASSTPATPAAATSSPATVTASAEPPSPSAVTSPRADLPTTPAATGTDTPAPGTEVPTATAVTTPSGATRAPSSAPSSSPTVAPTAYPPIAGLDELVGSDGRLTVLVLGSDARTGLGGERTDAIMVLTIDPSDGRVSAVSLPRDTEGVPTAPGRVYGGKVTGLYQSFTLAGATDEEAAQRTKAALAYAFGTEIDRYVLIGFDGLEKLVDAVGGVDVTLARPLDDTFLLVDGKRGFHLKKGLNHLDGKNALLFARTRHADNDYERTRRQQQLIIAAAAAVRERGVEDFPALVSVATGAIQTDIPFTSAPALFELLRRADLAGRRGTVLGPNKYAGPGKIRYSIVMRVPAVRALFDSWFGPVAPQ